jgi:hypothetical protein
MYRTDHGIPGIQKYDEDFRLLDMRFRYNSKVVYNTFNSIGIKGMKLYKKYLAVDYFFILCFLIIMVAISNLILPNTVYNNLLIILAFSRALFDVIENTIIIILINQYPDKNIKLATICSWSTTFKFISLYLWIIGIIFGTVYILIF